MIINCMNTQIIIPFLENLIKQIKDDSLNNQQYIDLFNFLYRFSKINTNNDHSNNNEQMIKFLITGWYINFIKNNHNKNDF